MAHIATWRPIWPCGYWHHGIECNDGSVIHFTNPKGTRKSKSNARIVRTTRQAFVGRRAANIYDVVYEDPSMMAAPDVVQQRAESRLGDGGYHVFVFNCESFARWCVTGVAQSLQVRNVKKSLTFAVPLVGSIAAVTTRLARRRASASNDVKKAV